MLAQARVKAEAGMAAERSMFPTTASPRVPSFIVHDISKRFPFEDASFDRVICALVFDHVADLKPVFAEMARVCKPGGFVIVTSMHPAVFLLGRQANFTNDAGEEIRPASVANDVSAFVMAAQGAGLRIADMREKVATAELVALTSKAEKYLGWPLLLAMKLAR
jgi:ubiquinone/menaquinone biosynthesis C-methylase UbiE